PGGGAGAYGDCADVGLGVPNGPPAYSGSPKRTYWGATGNWRTFDGSGPKTFLRTSGTGGVFGASLISVTPTLWRTRLCSDFVTIELPYRLSLALTVLA